MKSKCKILIRALMIISLVAFITCYFGSAFYLRFKYQRSYNEGVSLLESGCYDKAIDCFNEIPDCRNYKDIGDLLKDHQLICPYCGSVIE